MSRIKPGRDRKAEGKKAASQVSEMLLEECRDRTDFCENGDR